MKHEEIISALEEEREYYKAEILKLSKGEIYEKSYDIAVVENIFGFFENKDFGETREREYLCKVYEACAGKVLSVLSDYYFHDEYASISTDGEIEEMIDRFLSR